MQVRLAKRSVSLTSLVVLACTALHGCGSDDNTTPAEQAIPLTVPKASCGANDKPETGLQGQVPAAIRATGFNGFSCNLQLVGQSKNDGASWQHAAFGDRNGHTCSYYSTNSPVNGTANRTHTGVVALDVAEPTTPTPTAYLTTAAMLDPWESLRVNERRQLLGGESGTNAAGTGQLDLYDLSGDCRFPQLLSSTPIGTVANGDDTALPAGQTLAGHEGNFSVDGLTWYSGDRGTPKKYTAIDISNTTHPKLLTTWTLPQAYPTAVTTHGLTLRDDGNRAYVSQAGVLANPATILTAVPTNGLLILDTSEVQSRQPNPQIRQVSVLTWKDGGQMQHTIPVTINNKSYVVAVDESGSAGSNLQAACNAGLPPFPMARIIDISDETKPVVASKLMLEVHDPKFCAQVLPDLVGLSLFTYGSHYCSVDNKYNATTLACGYFNSGIRVFDIRDPLRPREIAYFNPAGVTTPSYGSNHFNPTAFINSGGQAGGPDWCSAQIRLDAKTASLQTTCQDNGFLSLKFTNDVWPFPTSSTPPGAQN